MSVRPSTTPPATGGLLSALRAAGGTLNELLRIRGGLFAVELREEMERRKQQLLLAAVGFAFLHTALLVCTVFVAAVFWENHRIAALGVMALLYLGCGAAAIIGLRRAAAAAPAPFAGTLGELDRDLNGLRASA